MKLYFRIVWITPELVWVDIFYLFGEIIILLWFFAGKLPNSPSKGYLTAGYRSTKFNVNFRIRGAQEVSVGSNVRRAIQVLPFGSFLEVAGTCQLDSCCEKSVAQVE